MISSQVKWTHWCFCFRYDRRTGTFTVPSGGAGLYYFSIYLLVGNGEYGRFSIRVNAEILCTAYGDESSNSGNDQPQATCSGLFLLLEGMSSKHSNPWPSFEFWPLHSAHQHCKKAISWLSFEQLSFFGFLNSLISHSKKCMTNWGWCFKLIN